MILKYSNIFVRLYYEFTQYYPQTKCGFYQRIILFSIYLLTSLTAILQMGYNLIRKREVFDNTFGVAISELFIKILSLIVAIGLKMPDTTYFDRVLAAYLTLMFVWLVVYYGILLYCWVYDLIRYSKIVDDYIRKRDKVEYDLDGLPKPPQGLWGKLLKFKEKVCPRIEMID